MNSDFCLQRFLFKSLLLMPLCFICWYFTAPIWIWLVSVSANVILHTLFPYLIASVEQTDIALTVVTNLADFKYYADEHKFAALTFSVNPLSYGYSLAFYSAIFLAAPVKPLIHKVKTWCIGLSILLLILTFGVCTDALKSIAFDLAPAGMNYPIGFSEWQLNMLGICYQLGYLILPSTAPLLLWVQANKNLLLVNELKE